MYEAQRFLEKYASIPIGSVDKRQARLKLQRIGILTENNEITEKYMGVIVKTELRKGLDQK